MLARENFNEVLNYQTFYLTTFGNIYLLGVTVILFSLSRITDNSLEVAEKELDKNRVLNKNLEKKVRERTDELKTKNVMLNDALINVEESRKKVMDSIEYAQRIQNSLFPNLGEVKDYLPDSFFVLKQRDIVGGDFIAVEIFASGIVVAVIDCTGHGVPGALMTMIASSAFRRITQDEKILDPAEILKRLNHYVKTSLHQDTEYATSDDGLDASVCFINLQKRTLAFSGARLPLFFVQNHRIQTIKGDRQSLGYKNSNLEFEFTQHLIDVEEVSSFYLFSDGLFDQLGGPRRFSFGYKRLEELLLAIQTEPFESQKAEILRVFDEYRGDNEVQDDITVVGFRFSGQG